MFVFDESISFLFDSSYSVVVLCLTDICLLGLYHSFCYYLNVNINIWVHWVIEFIWMLEQVNGKGRNTI